MAVKRNLAFSTIEKKCEIRRRLKNSSMTKDHNISSLFYERCPRKLAHKSAASVIVKTFK
jgi:hypothetical protein